MRKVFSIVVASMALSFLSFTSSMAELSMGVSLSHGVYKASGSENEDGEITSASAESKFSYPSVFAEWNTGVVSIGIEVIPGSVTTDQASRTDLNLGDADGIGTGNDGTTSGVTNTAEVSISQHVTLYGLLPIMDSGAYLKAGISRMDVKTNESLATGSTYGDVEGVQGLHASLGYQHDTGGAFFRAEIGYSEYDNVSVKGSNSHTVQADIEGKYARISIGHTF